MLWQLSSPHDLQEVNRPPQDTAASNNKYQIKCLKELKSTETHSVINCARFSPHQGNFIASGTDGGILRVWNLKEALQSSDSNAFSSANCGKNMQNDSFSISDLAWVGVQHLVTVSMSVAGSQSGGRCIMWDVASRSPLKVFDDKFKGFLQGCCVDPFGKYVAVQSTNRCSKFYEIRYSVSSKHTSQASSSSGTTAAPPTNSTSSPVQTRTMKNVVKLKTLTKGQNFIFRADNATMFTRRTNWSPDSLLCCMTAAALNTKDLQNVALLFLRDYFDEPICVLPVDEVVVGCAWSPVFYELREQKEPQLFPLKSVMCEGKSSEISYRQLLAVLTKKTVYIYDTHNKHPVAIIKNMHLSTLTDASFSADGMSLLVASHDGYASVIQFEEKEIGKALSVEELYTQEHLVRIGKENKMRFQKELSNVEDRLFPVRSKENNPNILNVRR